MIRNLLHILLRNWQMKLGAVVLATALYTGFVFSGSFSEDVQPGIVLESINQPAGWVLMGTGLGSVDVTYRADAQTADLVSAETFDATVDLTGYDLTRPAQPQSVEISVRPILPGVSVEDWSPREITITLDEIRTAQVPVRVDTGTLPAGLELGRPDLSDDEVTARGASSLLARVDHALARVRIDPSGIDASGPVVLVAVAVDGSVVEPIELTPSSVTIQIDVRAVETTKTIPIRPTVVGTPGPGFVVESFAVDPAVVTVRGDVETLSDLTQVGTEELDIDGDTTNQTFQATLVLPEGISLEGTAEPTASVTVVIGAPNVGRTILAGIVCEGAPSGSACLPGLAQVSVTLGGPADVLAALDASGFSVVLDVSGLGPGSHQVEPTLSGLPADVDLVAISPSAVPVTIQPPTPAPTPTPQP